MLATLLLDGTPNTVNYMVLGFAFLLGLPIVYALSFHWRRRNLERDLELVQSLRADEVKRAAAPAGDVSRLPGEGSQPSASSLP